MKSRITGLIFIGMFSLMLINPHTVIQSAADGLLLWYQVLVPTLFPFMILSSFLIKSNIISTYTPLLKPVFGKIFSTDSNGAYCIICGFLCGYPMGAKVIGEMYEERALSKKHAEYLLSFCNNVSPGFISGFIVISCLKNTDLLVPTICILYGVPLCYSFFYRVFVHNPSINNNDPIRQMTNKISFHHLNDVVMSSLTSIMSLGGYVIIFGVFSGFLRSIKLNNAAFSYIKAIASGLLEITSGIPQIMNLETCFPMKYALVLTSASFGGLCGIAQTWGILNIHSFSIKNYALRKLIQALTAGVIGYLYMSAIFK